MGAESSKDSTGFLQQLADKGANIVIMNPVIHIHMQDRISNSTDSAEAELNNKLLAEIKMKDEQIEFERQQKEIMEAFLQQLFGRREESFYMENEPISQLRESQPTIVDKSPPSKRRKRSKSETYFRNDSTELRETRNGTKFIYSVHNSNSWNQNAKEVDSQSSCSQQKSQPESTNYVFPPPTTVPASVPASTLCETENTPVLSFDKATNVPPPTSVPASVAASIPSTLCETENTPVLIDKSTNVDRNTTNLSQYIAASDTTKPSDNFSLIPLSDVSISLSDIEMERIYFV